jgi:hypothetical protein
MVNNIYNLPKLSFIGGGSQKFRFRLVTPRGGSYDANGCNAVFSLINYSNKNGEPLVVKNASLEIGDDGVPNIAVVELLPEDTVDMYGRYVYQLSIRDAWDEVELPGQGLIDITRNTYRKFIA